MEPKIICLEITMAFGQILNTVHPVLLLDGKNRVLVDCGFSGCLPLLEEQLKKHGLTPEEITGLVLTHHDHDHMGAAAALKRINPGIRICASPAETPLISGRETPLRLRQACELQKHLSGPQREFGEAFCAMLERVEPVHVDCQLEDRTWLDWCGGCQVLNTPGHTRGHISLYLEKQDVVITGDAMALENGVPAVANLQFAQDPDQAGQSLQAFLDLRARLYCCYHGGTYSPEAAAEAGGCPE